MNKFIPGEGIAKRRNGNVILKKGTVLKGPEVIEGIDHYQVKWEDGEVEVISDQRSLKYDYTSTIGLNS